MTLFIATLGQRPQAITLAFDVLCGRYSYEAMLVVHTDADQSGIRESLGHLKTAMATHFPQVMLICQAVSYPDGRPLIDLTDSHTATLYFDALLELFQDHKQSGKSLHLLVAGGRKAMSIYAMLAASRLFDPPTDQVWTVLSDPSLLDQGQVYTLPPGQRDLIRVVDLPLLTVRLAPGANPHALEPRSRGAAFWAKLTRQESELVRALLQNPYAGNTELAQILVKSPSTVENQFRSIYAKLIGFLEFGESIPDSAKRLALLDVVRAG